RCEYRGELMCEKSDVLIKGITKNGHASEEKENEQKKNPFKNGGGQEETPTLLILRHFVPSDKFRAQSGGKENRVQSTDKIDCRKSPNRELKFGVSCHHVVLTCHHHRANESSQSRQEVEIGLYELESGGKSSPINLECDICEKEA
ncbi:MAG: hypothetical protein SWE60_23740, partial [Thermodesulfobacteriota bacterium]|nr:hypothetical protein [Thermodesulfobacteriota bacterium]